MAITITVKGAKELVTKLETMAKLETVKAAIEQAGGDLQGFMKEYPANTVRMANPLLREKSEKGNRVRRGFFARLKSGEISVPYGQSGFLGDNWTYAPANEGMQAIVANGISYNDWVQGGKQTAQHTATGWLTVDKAVETYGPGIIQQISDALDAEVANVG
jgi:hypothetical protein